MKVFKENGNCREKGKGKCISVFLNGKRKFFLFLVTRSIVFNQLTRLFVEQFFRLFIIVETGKLFKTNSHNVDSQNTETVIFHFPFLTTRFWFPYVISTHALS